MILLRSAPCFYSIGRHILDIYKTIRQLKEIGTYRHEKLWENTKSTCNSRTNLTTTTTIMNGNCARKKTHRSCSTLVAAETAAVLTSDQLRSLNATETIELRSASGPRNAKPRPRNAERGRSTATVPSNGNGPTKRERSLCRGAAEYLEGSGEQAPPPAGDLLLIEVSVLPFALFIIVGKFQNANVEPPRVPTTHYNAIGPPCARLQPPTSSVRSIQSFHPVQRS